MWIWVAIRPCDANSRISAHFGKIKKTIGDQWRWARTLGLCGKYWSLLYKTTEVMTLYPQWTLIGIFCSKTDCCFFAVTVKHKMHKCVHTKMPDSNISSSGRCAYGQWESALYQRNPISFVCSAWIIQVIVMMSSKWKENKPY